MQIATPSRTRICAAAAAGVALAMGLTAPAAAAVPGTVTVSGHPVDGSPDQPLIDGCSFTLSYAGFDGGVATTGFGALNATLGEGVQVYGTATVDLGHAASEPATASYRVLGDAGTLSDGVLRLMVATDVAPGDTRTKVIAVRPCALPTAPAGTENAGGPTMVPAQVNAGGLTGSDMGGVVFVGGAALAVGGAAWFGTRKNARRQV